jgi:hypothetical protein
MSGYEWTRRVLEAARDVSRAARGASPGASPGDGIGRLLILMGRAAGHADQMAGDGPTADKARDHFRAELRQVGALALELLQEMRDRGRGRSITNDELAEDVARRRVLGGSADERERGAVRVGHSSAALGAAIAAIGRAVQMVPLDDEHLPRLDATLESVLAHAITAVARS